MATGKTNSKHFRLLVDEFDLSSSSQNIGSFGTDTLEEDVTAWSDGWKNVTLGHKVAVFSGYQAVFNNATDGAYTVLSTPAERIVTMAIGIRAAPAVGDPTMSMQVEQLGFNVSNSSPIMISMESSKSTSSLTDQSRNWGELLAIGTSLSGTTNNASVNFGGQTDTGIIAFLHITASSGGSWTFKVQDSANDAAWSDLITFSADGSAVTSEAATASGTIEQYLRFRAEFSSGTVSAWCSAVRNNVGSGIE